MLLFTLVFCDEFLLGALTVVLLDTGCPAGEDALGDGKLVDELVFDDGVVLLGDCHEEVF